MTLVLDREGWSPALFRRLARRGVAVLTWHKNFKGADWPQADFHEVEVPIHGPATTCSSTVRLAEDARNRILDAPVGDLDASVSASGLDDVFRDSAIH